MRRKPTHDWWPKPKPPAVAQPIGKSWPTPTPEEVHQLAVELSTLKFPGQSWDELGSGWQHQFLDEARAGLNPLPKGKYTQPQLEYFSAQRPLGIRTQRVIEAAQQHHFTRRGGRWLDLEVEEQLEYFKFAEATLAQADTRRAQQIALEDGELWFDLTDATRELYMHEAYKMQDADWDPEPYRQWRALRQ